METSTETSLTDSLNTSIDSHVLTKRRSQSPNTKANTEKKTNGWKVSTIKDKNISEKENSTDNIHSVSNEEERATQSSSNVDDINAKISYKDAASYWNNIPATVDGMLGGFAHISSTDIVGSQAFLKSLLEQEVNKPGRSRCVDCGAGIGRITRKLLQHKFGKVDMVEQCPVFADKCRETFIDNPKLGEIYCIGLQDFSTEKPIYDVVWVQWVIIYLPDQDLVAFFRRMGQALKPNGVIVVKDNFTTDTTDEPAETLWDEQDSSVTRPLECILKLAKEAGLKLVKSQLQKKFPKKLFPVYMLAFIPEQYNTSQ